MKRLEVKVSELWRKVWGSCVYLKGLEVAWGVAVDFICRLVQVYFYFTKSTFLLINIKEVSPGSHASNRVGSIETMFWSK